MLSRHFILRKNTALSYWVFFAQSLILWCRFEALGLSIKSPFKNFHQQDLNWVLASLFKGQYLANFWQGNFYQFYLKSEITHVVRPSVDDEWCPVASQRWPPPLVICYDRTHGNRRTTWIWSNSEPIPQSRCQFKMDLRNLGNNGNLIFSIFVYQQQQCVSQTLTSVWRALIQMFISGLPQEFKTVWASLSQAKASFRHQILWNKNWP